MTEQVFEVASIGELAPVAEAIMERLDARPVLLIEGAMGSGKTTLVKAICHALGSEDRVSSPTFSLVNEYHKADGTSFYHFDLYRVEQEDELLDMGFEEYIDSGSACLIEWPEIAKDLLPKEVSKISITENDGLRSIILHD